MHQHPPELGLEDAFAPSVRLRAVVFSTVFSIEPVLYSVLYTTEDVFSIVVSIESETEGRCVATAECVAVGRRDAGRNRR